MDRPEILELLIRAFSRSRSVVAGSDDEQQLLQFVERQLFKAAHLPTITFLEIVIQRLLPEARLLGLSPTQIRTALENVLERSNPDWQAAEKHALMTDEIAFLQTLEQVI